MSPTEYLEVYKAMPYERIGMIKSGVSASDAQSVLRGFAPSSELIAERLGVSWPAIVKGSARDQTLSTDAGERIVGLARLVGQVEAMTGSVEGFEAQRWMATWLLGPVAALGGGCPADFLDTMEGRDLVSNLLARMQTSAYA